MNVSLTPKTEKYLRDQVEKGQFASPDEVLEEAVGRMMAEGELDDETVAAINRAEEQLDRGEGVSFTEFAGTVRGRLTLCAESRTEAARGWPGPGR